MFQPWSQDWSTAFGPLLTQGRTLLTVPAAFYCNTQTGRLANDGRSISSPLPQPQDVADRLQQKYDIGGMTVDIYLADGQIFDGVTIFGPFVGARGPSVTLHGGSSLGAAVIRPAAGRHGVALAFDATLQIMNCTIDHSDGSQDCVAVGQGSHLVVTGYNRLIQANPYTYNHFSIYEGSNVDVFMQAGGSGQLYLRGIGAVGIDCDESSSFVAQCNGVHGLIGFWAESNGSPGTPYWADAFVDVAAGSKVDLAGVDFHGAGYGYRYRVREGGTLRLNLEGDPGQLAAMFGSQDTAWPVRGYLV